MPELMNQICSRVMNTCKKQVEIKITSTEHLVDEQCRLRRKYVPCHHFLSLYYSLKTNQCWVVWWQLLHRFNDRYLKVHKNEHLKHVHTFLQTPLYTYKRPHRHTTKTKHRNIIYTKISKKELIWNFDYKIQF